MSRGKLIALAVVLGFAAFLLYTTLSAQKVVCHVCVEFNGRQNCADASHENEAEAARAAQTTACGPLVQGMNETIACSNRTPVLQRCRTS